MTQNIRALALEFLQKDINKSMMKFELEKIEGKLSKRDRSFLQQILYGCIRWKLTLEHLVHQMCRRISNNSDEFYILQMGFYQLMFMSTIPPHAIVYETVELKKQNTQAKKFLNGVLRAFQRSIVGPPFQNISSMGEHSLLLRKSEPQIVFKRPFFAHKDPLQQLSLRSSHPRWIVDAYLKVMSRNQLKVVLCQNNLTPPNTIRTNALKISAEDLKKGFEDAGISTQYSCHPMGFHIELKGNVFDSSLFQEGNFSFQDTWSMEVVDRLAPQPEECILDLCAAPGGKTSYMAETMKNQGEIIAVDNEKRRVQKIVENQTRLGLKIIKTKVAAAEEVHFEKPFDRILLDAPCSNSGAFSRRIEARYRQSQKGVTQLAELQKKILANVPKLLKAGGRFVYSTCSLFEEENQQQAATFIKSFPEFTLVEEQLFLPGKPHFSGGYVAVFQKKS